MNSQTMPFRGRVKKQITTRNIAKAVGEARGSIPLKAGRVADIVGHSATQETRIRQGERMSATGRAAVAIYEAVMVEACPIEAAGQCSAIIEFTLRTIAMWPELERLSKPEWLAELRDEIARRETRANGKCNDLDAAFLAGDAPDLSAMLERHTEQGTASIRIAAILQLLTRPDR